MIDQPLPSHRIHRVLLATVIAVLGVTVWLTIQTLHDRFARDVVRLVFNDNLDAVDRVRREANAGSDTLRAQLDTTPAAKLGRPYIVVSIADRRLWYKQGDSVLFTAPVATGSGKTVTFIGSSRVYHFETPRGRLVVERRDSAPAWVPPDWHYLEQARKRGLSTVQLVRGEPIQTKDGGEVTVVGNDVVRKSKDGSTRTLSAEEGREIVVDGKIVIPPYGTTQRKYMGVLGAYRLYLGDGYGLHGTNEPKSVGQAVSHGCVRLRNEDITVLYDRVAIGTPVYIY